MLQLGVLMGIVLLGNVLVANRLPIENVPVVLRQRVLLCNRMRPWLGALALAFTVGGLVLLLA